MGEWEVLFRHVITRVKAGDPRKECGEETKSDGGISLEFSGGGVGSGRSVFHDACLVVDRMWGGMGGTCIHVVGPRTGLGGAGSR